MRTMLSRGCAARGLVLSLLMATGQAGGVSAQRSLGAMIQDTTLENGLAVVVVPNSTVPLVTIQVTIRNGAFTQLAEPEEGLPHVLEHMLFRGYGRNGFTEAANKLNASYNGTTSDETVTYYITLPSENLDDGVELMANLMRSPDFRRDDLDQEKLVVRGELERAASNPVYLLANMVDLKLWGTGYRQKNPIGNVLTITSATTDQLKQTYERFYVPNNAAVVFSGDVTTENAFASSARHFTRWRAAADPFADLELVPPPALERNDVALVTTDANDVTILVRWHGPSVRTDRDATYAADMFTELVNDPVSGLQERLIDSGLFQSVSMSYLTQAFTGPITLHATTTADQLVAASAALREEVDRFDDADYFTPEMLEIARKQSEVAWAMAAETPSGLASFVGELWSVADLEYARGYVAATRGQTQDDLRRLVTTYITGKPRVFGLMMSPATRSELGNAVVGRAMMPWRQ